MKRVAIVVGVVAVIAGLALVLSPARLIVADIDGPPVQVAVAGVGDFSVDCNNTKTFVIPLFHIASRDVTVLNARTGSVLRRLTLTGDVVVLVRRDGVLYGAPSASYGPAPVGCA
jgi:hypothetical protein